MIRKRFLLTGLMLSLLLLALFLLPGLSDYDLSDRYRQPVAFSTPSAVLSGSLLLPEERRDVPVLILVQGDGPLDRFAGGAYLPLINALLDRGIGVFTWDKPGVGASTGDWLKQSMADRADETRAALQALESVDSEYHLGPIGFLGFSQAGWVLPQVALNLEAEGSVERAFILIGAAANWQRQGRALTRFRLQAEGYSDAQIERVIRQQSALDQQVLTPPTDYARYRQQATDQPLMSEARFHFVARNYRADSTGVLAQIASPMLMMLGAEDLNLDARQEAMTFKPLLENGHPASRVKVWPEATHSLTRARWLNYQRPDQIPWYAQLYALVAGRDIYAPGALDYLTAWFFRVHPSGA